MSRPASFACIQLVAHGTIIRGHSLTQQLNTCLALSLNRGGIVAFTCLVNVGSCSILSHDQLLLLGTQSQVPARRSIMFVFYSGSVHFRHTRRLPMTSFDRINTYYGLRKVLVSNDGGSLQEMACHLSWFFCILRDVPNLLLVHFLGL